MEWYWILIICTTIIVVILMAWCCQILFSEKRSKVVKKRNLKFVPYTARQSHLHTIISQGDLESRSYTFEDSRNSINSYALKKSAGVGSVAR